MIALKDRDCNYCGVSVPHTAGMTGIVTCDRHFRRDVSIDEFYDESFPHDPLLNGMVRAEIDRMRSER